MSFLKYNGQARFNKKERVYEFEIKDKKGIKIFNNKYLISIPNPIIDNNFRQVFGQNPDITKDLLNKIIFPKSHNILKVTYLPEIVPDDITKVPAPIKAYGADSIRVDVLCKCTLKQNIIEDINDNYFEELEDKINKILENEFKENNIKQDEENEIIIDLELQIGFNIENTRLSLNYAKELDSLYEKYRIIVLCLVYEGQLSPNKNRGSVISINQKGLNDFRFIHKLDDYIIYQIDLDYIRKSIFEDNKRVSILNEEEKFTILSDEWIKYLTLPSWCTSFNEGYYAIPCLEEKYFENKYVFEALNILYDKDETQTALDLIDEKLKAKKRKNDEKKMLLIENQRKEIKKKYEEIEKKDEEIEKKDEEIDQQKKIIKEKDENMNELQKRIDDLEKKLKNNNLGENKSKDKSRNKRRGKSRSKSRSKSNNKNKKNNYKKKKSTNKYRKTKISLSRSKSSKSISRSSSKSSESD